MITCTRVVKGEGLIFPDIYLIAKIINNPDKKYTTIFFNFSLDSFDLLILFLHDQVLDH